MKPGYTIDQFGATSDIRLIIVFNWTGSQKVGMACFYSESPTGLYKENATAIFKIKYK